jgi:hypothetical protein
MHPFAQLAWLLPAPENFSERAKAIRAASSDATHELRALASHALEVPRPKICRESGNQTHA